MNGQSSILILIIMEILTAVFSYMMFRQLYMGKNTAKLYGTILYMMCPFRIYTVYTQKDLNSSVIWMLIPLYICLMTILLWRGQAGQESGSRGKTILAALPASLILAAAARLDIIHFLIIGGISLCAALYFRRILAIIPLFFGCVLSIPQLISLKSCISGETFDELGLSLDSISDKGYSIGGLFSSYVFRNDSPGIGLALFLCMVVGLWLIFVRNKVIKEIGSFIPFFTIMGILLSIVSLRYFPWDYVRRISPKALRLVAMLETPVIFFGYAQIGFCVLGAGIMEALHSRENRIVDLSIKFLVMIAAVGSGIYYIFIK